MHLLSFPTMALLAISAGGCAPTVGGGTRSVACDAFGPLTWSRKDTRDTIRGIQGHNATGKALCGWQGKR